MSDKSEGSEQSDTLNRNIAEGSIGTKQENLTEAGNETGTITEPEVYSSNTISRNPTRYYIVSHTDQE